MTTHHPMPDQPRIRTGPAAASSMPSTSSSTISANSIICCQEAACLVTEPRLYQSSGVTDGCDTTCSASPASSEPGDGHGSRAIWSPFAYNSIDCDQCVPDSCCHSQVCTPGPALDCPDCSPRAISTTEMSAASSVLVLNDLLQGLDDRAIQEILNCCCCAPEIERQPENWDISHHISHASTSLHHDHGLCSGVGQTQPLLVDAAPPLNSRASYTCRWSHCNAIFQSHAQLTTHVNSAHLGVADQLLSTSNLDHQAWQNNPIPPIQRSGAARSPFDSPESPQPSCSPHSSLPSFSAASHSASIELNSDVQPRMPGSYSTTPMGLLEAAQALHSPKADHLVQVQRSEGVNILQHSAPTAPPSSVPNTRSCRAPDLVSRRNRASSQRATSVASHGASARASPYMAHERSNKSYLSDGSSKPDDSYTCRWSGCVARYDSSAELMAHLSELHVGAGKALYECHWDDCSRNCAQGKAFTQRQKIMRHLQSHTHDRPFACEICGKAFAEATTLTQHKRVHTQERPYECTWSGCDKAFALASSLTIHMRTHTGDRPFVCPFCPASFVESSNLTKHVRTHRGERTHVCTDCQKCFLRSDQLTRHRKICTVGSRTESQSSKFALM